MVLANHLVYPWRVSRARVRSCDTVPSARAQRTPPAATAEPFESAQASPSHNTHFGRPTPADAEALRGLPAIGYGIGGGAIKGSVPGRNLH